MPAGATCCYDGQTYCSSGVCCGGGYCAPSYGDCSGSGGSGGSSGSGGSGGYGYCDPGEVVCDDGCMPAGATCCHDGQTYCSSGVCCGDGTCSFSYDGCDGSGGSSGSGSGGSFNTGGSFSSGGSGAYSSGGSGAYGSGGSSYGGGSGSGNEVQCVRAEVGTGCDYVESCCDLSGCWYEADGATFECRSYDCSGAAQAVVSYCQPAAADDDDSGCTVSAGQPVSGSGLWVAAGAVLALFARRRRTRA